MSANGSVATPGRADLGRILAGAALMFAVLQGGLLLLVPIIGQTPAALVVSAGMLSLALGFERVLFGRATRAALLALGFGRPTRGAIVVSALISVAMLTFFPAYSLITGVPISLRADWAWVLLGAIALNGIAEEALFRGFVFGHLRRAGHSFTRAGLVSMAVFAAVHALLFLWNPFVVAFLAIVLAIAAAFPLAFMYERARATIWGAAIVHVAGHGFRLVDVPEADITAVATAWILLQIAAFFTVFIFRGNLLRPVDQRIAAVGAAS